MKELILSLACLPFHHARALSLNPPIAPLPLGCFVTEFGRPRKKSQRLANPITRNCQSNRSGPGLRWPPKHV